MKKAKILFNAFVEASHDAHVGYLLYSEEVWGKGIVARAPGSVAHTKKWEECQVDSCRMRYELASYMHKKL